MTSSDIAKALVAIIESIVETVNESPDGAPAGVMYAALMHYGCSHSQFESLMGALVRKGRIRQEGHLYFPVK